MIYRPPEESAPELGGRGTGRRTDFIVRRSLRAAYRDLQAIAQDRHEPVVLRALARLAAIPIHRILLLIATGTASKVEAAGYLDNTIDVAAGTARAINEPGATR